MGILPMQLETVPRFRLLLTGLSPRRYGFNPRQLHVRFFSNKIATIKSRFVSTSVFFHLVSFHQCSLLLHSFITIAIQS